MLSKEHRELLEATVKGNRINADTILIGDDYPQAHEVRHANRLHDEANAIEAALKALDEAEAKVRMTEHESNIQDMIKGKP